VQSFEDKVVVITGAGSGIGRACAEAFAREGARVHVSDIDEGRATQVASAIGGTAHVNDCSKVESVEALAEAVYAQHGRVDILHNNAGIGHGAPIEETTLEDWQRVIGVNLWGVIHGIHVFVPRLLAQGGESHIVNTSSGLGLIAAPTMSPYCATKFAVVGISEALAAELHERGISVTAVCPGIINTDIVNKARMSDSFEDVRRTALDIYSKRGVAPEVVAKDVLAAVRAKRVIKTSPPSHVLPLWGLKRISQSAYQLVQRVAKRRIL